MLCAPGRKKGEENDSLPRSMAVEKNKTRLASVAQTFHPSTAESIIQWCRLLHVVSRLNHSVSKFNRTPRGSTNQSNGDCRPIENAILNCIHNYRCQVFHCKQRGVDSLQSLFPTRTVRVNQKIRRVPQNCRYVKMLFNGFCLSSRDSFLELKFYRRPI